MINEPKVITVMMNIPDEKTGEDHWHDDIQIAVTDELKAAFAPVIKVLPEYEKKELQVYREVIEKSSRFSVSEHRLNFGDKNKYQRSVVPVGDCYIIHPEDWKEMRAKLQLLATLKEENKNDDVSKT